METAQAAGAVAPQAAVAAGGGYALPGQQTGLSVTGMGRIQAKPDVATVSVGLQTTANTAQEAMAQNSAQMEKVIAAIKGQGITDDDIRTTGVNLVPVYEQRRDPSTQPPRVVGYRATNQVRVEVKDLSKVGAVLDAAVTAGANLAGGVSFSIRDVQAVSDQALRQAVADAQRKAQTIATAAGVKLGAVTSIFTDYINVPTPDAYYGRGGAGDFAVEALAAVPAPIEPGQLTITAQVRVVYDIQK